MSEVYLKYCPNCKRPVIDGWNVCPTCGFDMRIVRQVDSLTQKRKSTFEIADGVLKKYNGRGGDVIIPAGVTRIDDYAFRGCEGLESVKIGNNVKSIGKWAFENCYNLTKVIIISDVKIIEDWAFSYCVNLTSIQIPRSVKRFCNGVFSDCINLKTIVFDGRIGRWKAVKKGKFWDFHMSDYTVLCHDGKFAETNKIR